MSRPYTWDPKYRMYAVSRDRSTTYRPNRTAAGLTVTHARRKGDRSFTMSSTALALTINGTTDTLARVVSTNTRRAEGVCPCCRQRTPKLVLSDRGQKRLRQLRALRDQRLQLSAQESQP